MHEQFFIGILFYLYIIEININKQCNPAERVSVRLK